MFSFAKAILTLAVISRNFNAHVKNVANIKSRYRPWIKRLWIMPATPILTPAKQRRVGLGGPRLGGGGPSLSHTPKTNDIHSLSPNNF